MTDTPNQNPITKAEADDSAALNALLASHHARQSCIERVKQQLPAILQARQQKITWDAIAESLGLQRCTLINAVRILSQPAQSVKLAQPPQISINPAAHATPFIKLEAKAEGGNTDVILTDTGVEEPPAADGIVALGRANRAKFNL